MAAVRLLDGLGIACRLAGHKPIFTLEEGMDADVIEQLGVPMDNLVKCLLLRDTHDRLFLVVASGEARVDLKAVTRRLGTTRLSFASADLMRDTLGSEPGATSLFDLTDNPHAKAVRVVLDEHIATLEGDIGFHVGTNTVTLLFTASALPQVAASLDPDYVAMELHGAVQ